MELTPTRFLRVWQVTSRTGPARNTGGWLTVLLDVGADGESLPGSAHHELPRLASPVQPGLRLFPAPSGSAVVAVHACRSGSPGESMNVATAVSAGS